jgi:hypothetical protein
MAEIHQLALKGWSYELARGKTAHESYCDWGPPQISFRKPSVPEGSIRNLTPLYALQSLGDVA